MPNNITPPRVPLTDPRTGLVAREWYMFFFSLFNLTGAGQNVASITDLQVGPPATDAGEVEALLGQFDAAPSESLLLAQIAEVLKAIQALRVAPPTADTSALTKAIQALQIVPPAPDTTALVRMVQGLQVTPPIPTMGPTIIGLVSAALDFPNTLAQLSSDLTITVPGAVDGDDVDVCVPNACTLANSCYTGWVSAADTVTVRFNNYSAGAQNPASGTFRVIVKRY